MQARAVYPNKFQNDAFLKWEEEKKGKKVKDCNKATGSVLIPEFLEEFYSARAKAFRSGYLKFLVESYSYLLLQEYDSDEENKQWLGLSSRPTLNTGYQQLGMDLQKHYIRVESEVWAMLKQLRNLLNQSVCKIVTFLVYLDWLGIEETIPQEIKQIVVPAKKKFILHYEAQFNTKMWHYTRRSRFKRFDFF